MHAFIFLLALVLSNIIGQNIHAMSDLLSTQKHGDVFRSIIIAFSNVAAGWRNRANISTGDKGLVKTTSCDVSIIQSLMMGIRHVGWRHDTKSMVSCWINSRNDADGYLKIVNILTRSVIFLQNLPSLTLLTELRSRRNGSHTLSPLNGSSGTRIIETRSRKKQ